MAAPRSWGRESFAGCCSRGRGPGLSDEINSLLQEDKGNWGGLTLAPPDTMNEPACVQKQEGRGSSLGAWASPVSAWGPLGLCGDSPLCVTWGRLRAPQGEKSGGRKLVH